MLIEENTGKKTESDNVRARTGQTYVNKLSCYKRTKKIQAVLPFLNVLDIDSSICVYVYTQTHTHTHTYTYTHIHTHTHTYTHTQYADMDVNM